MLRKSEKLLKNWLVKPNRKPLVLRGARQVGKSTLVRQVMAGSNIDLCEVNCELHPQLDAAFATLNTERIIDEIESLPRVKPIGPETVLFLDEVQATPHALAALRYFHEERSDLKIICAGSLLDFALERQTFSMPVGRVEFQHVVPMDFEEFLWACGEDKLSEVLIKFTLEKPMSPDQHARLLDLQQKYFFVGGMPEAVREYARSRKLSSASEVHESILETYKLDFLKYGLRQDLPRLARVLDHCAQQIAKPVKLTKILPDEQARTVRRLLGLLIHARRLSPVIHSDANDPPLGAEEHPDVFKLIMLDIGLMNALVGATWNQFKNSDTAMKVRDGAVAEQFIGQELISSVGRGRQKLNFWLRNGKSANAEVDYVAVLDDQIIPIEVKAGKSGTLRSLKTFCEHKRPAVAFRFDTQLPSLQHLAIDSSATAEKPMPETCVLVSLPLYALSQMARIHEAVHSDVARS
ncbi:MAG: ATP-binding protein [Pseudomonadota bacterium]